LYKILLNKCAKYLHETAEERVDLVEYYKKTIVPEESFMQTILANSKLFNLCDKNNFYMDWKGSNHGRPKILTVSDYYTLTKDENFILLESLIPK